MPLMMAGRSNHRPRRREHGFVLISMAISAVALMGVLGLAVDVGRMFIAKNETQVYCDAAALAAALALDGSTAGIARAQAAVANSTNTWNFNTAAVTNPVIRFAKTTAGPWEANPSPATQYMYARVSATVPVTLYFLRVVVGQNSQNVSSTATAGQVAVSSLPQGLGPYTAVSTDPTGPSFGFQVGELYDIQWPQFNKNRTGCSSTNPDACFNSPPCSGEQFASKVAVVNAWSSSESGYWGSNSNSVIRDQVLNLSQTEPVSVGGNIDPVLTSGNKASQAGYLDERVNQDVNRTDNTVAGYLANAHNGRRLLPLLVAFPASSTQTTVFGYGQFLLLSNAGTNAAPSSYYQSVTNGNDPFCAVYAGPYTIGGTGVGAGGSTGATQVKLVQ
jgi:Flp pilus assembly protein TadG